MIKEMMAKNGVSKEAMEKYWPVFVKKLEDWYQMALEEKAEGSEEEPEPVKPAPVPTPTTTPATATAQARPMVTTGAPVQIDPVLLDKMTKTVDMYHRMTFDPTKDQKLRMDFQNPEHITKLKKIKNPLAGRPDSAQKVDAILRKLSTLGLQVEMSLPIGYPPYDKARKDLKAKGNNAWGVAGPSATGLSITGEPIRNWTKKKSLKEYLIQNQNNENNLLDYKKRLEDRVKNAKR
jgi:hypothetical protein